MIKAVVDFTWAGVTVQAGDEIKPDTFDADVLLVELFQKGLIAETVIKHDEPAVKAGKGKSK